MIRYYYVKGSPVHYPVATGFVLVAAKSKASALELINKGLELNGLAPVCLDQVKVLRSNAPIEKIVHIETGDH